MTFDDNDPNQPLCTLELSPGTSPNTVKVTLTAKPNDKPLIKRTADAVPREKMEALAQWIDDVSDASAPWTLDALGLRLSFSHREHIGEIYYDIFIDGRWLRNVYEQGGASNVARALSLRAELGRTLA